MNRPDKTKPKPTNLSYLRVLAAAAIPGRWHNLTNRHPNIDGTPWGCLERRAHPAGGGGTPLFKGFCWSGVEEQKTAEYIAAVRPDVVVGLLDEIEELRGMVVGLRSDDLAILLDWFGELRESADDEVLEAVARLTRAMKATGTSICPECDGIMDGDVHRSEYSVCVVNANPKPRPEQIEPKSTVDELVEAMEESLAAAKAMMNGLEGAAGKAREVQEGEGGGGGE